jgi:hypothetical protein
MIHIQKANNQTVAINPAHVLMVTEGATGCVIHFIGGVNTVTTESYLDIVAKLKTALEVR